MKEMTLAIIKPDAMQKGVQGKIIHQLIEEGFEILNIKQVHLTKKEAQAFYQEHKNKPFFQSLVAFITESPVWVLALRREDGVAYLRKLMGDTDATKAAPGTLRAEFGTNIERNAIHGSATLEDAQREVSFFFSEKELL